MLHHNIVLHTPDVLYNLPHNLLPNIRARCLVGKLYLPATGIAAVVLGNRELAPRSCTKRRHHVRSCERPKHDTIHELVDEIAVEGPVRRRDFFERLFSEHLKDGLDVMCNQIVEFSLSSTHAPRLVVRLGVM